MVQHKHASFWFSLRIHFRMCVLFNIKYDGFIKKGKRSTTTTTNVQRTNVPAKMLSIALMAATDRTQLGGGKCRQELIYVK